MVSAPDAASQSVGRPCGVGLEIPGLKLPEDFDLLTGVLKRPGSTVEEPLKLILNSDNTLSVSFIPKETGEHFVSVFKNKRHVSGSPFSVMVSGPGPANASKVKAYGPGLYVYCLKLMPLKGSFPRFVLNVFDCYFFIFFLYFTCAL